MYQTIVNYLFFTVCIFQFHCKFVCLFSLARQTLGEEYVHIIQVDPTKRHIPSRSRRCLFIFCHVFFPYLLDKTLVCLENQLDGAASHDRLHVTVSSWWTLEAWLRRSIQKVLGLMSESRRRTYLPTIFILQQSLSLLHRLHVALFYIFGSFYYLSKRVSGITHVREFVFSHILTLILILILFSSLVIQLAPRVMLLLYHHQSLCNKIMMGTKNVTVNVMQCHI